MTPSTDTRPQSRRFSSRLSNSTDRFQPSLNIEDILVEAQHRWLRPAEICEILRNYHKFHIAPEPANKPPSGSLFLFDRKILRYFRKDGHNWRKKKDGKTVKEAHERLKEESVDVLHCYYAHGEDNENFQRRTYWLLEESLMHIVLVHYLELKGSKASFSRARDDNGRTHMQMDSPACSSSFTSQNQLPSQTTDAGSPTSARTAEYEDADSDYCQTRSRYHPFLGMQQYEDGQLMVSSLLTPSVPIPSLNQYEHQTTQAITPESDHYSAPHEDIFEVLGKAGLDLALSEYDRTQLDLKSWVEGLDHTAKGYSNASFQASLETEGTANWDIPTQVTFTFGELLRDELPIKQTDDRKAKLQCANPEVGSYSPLKPNMKSEFSFEGNMIITKQTSLDTPNMGGEDLKKYDSFSKWMSRELGEVEEPNVKSNSQADWNFMETERVENSGMSHPEQLDAYLMGPFVSQDQLFSIVDFSPSWAYSISETKVLVTGKFLKDKDKVENIKLSCMFGELEVPAEILADGILRCYAPPHKSGKVPFYITCSNRLACSEVREFEFRANLSQCMENSGTCNTDEMSLHIRLGRLLSLGSVNHASSISTITDEKIHLSNRLSSVLMQDDDRWFNFLKLTNNEEFSPDRVKDELLQKLLKEKLHDWLLQKVAEGGKGPNILDKDGQGVLHLTAALGYDWAIKPTVIAGGNINFRDLNGWTALHWAAYCGRECTVVSLVTLGAFPGALTNPTSEFPSVRTPADLASENGHKGIAGFLAESSLTCHLSCLAIKDTSGIDMADTSDIGCMENLEEIAIPVVDGDMEEGHSLKDSLSAVRNAALAAARIHQAFRVDSFQRKRLAEFGDDQCGMSVEHALSLISVKTSKLGQHDMPIHAAAIKIQNKFRGWKGRKEFLITRQQIVKIQAHVRGHQVRKHYKNCWVWTVGIVEKAILRWRRKGSGLRGFRAEGLLEGTSMQTETAKENEYDFLKEGRKQAEARTEKALSRVKSMVQYPEARDQYRRLLNAASEVQESNLTEDTILNEAEAALGDITIELDEIWEDDAPMPST